VIHIERVRRLRAPRNTGPIAFALVTGVAIAAVLWGAFVSDPGITVVQFDAGPISDFEIRELRAFPEVDLYVVGLDDGRIRAIDGRINGTDRAARWAPDHNGAASRNPGRVLGAFVDDETGALWAITGDAVRVAESPLRTPNVTFLSVAGDDERHVFVDLINHPNAPE
jgi:hypothetical protein